MAGVGRCQGLGFGGWELAKQDRGDGERGRRGRRCKGWDSAPWLAISCASHHWLDEARTASCEKDTRDCMRAGRCFQWALLHRAPQGSSAHRRRRRCLTSSSWASHWRCRTVGANAQSAVGKEGTYHSFSEHREATASMRQSLYCFFIGLELETLFPIRMLQWGQGRQARTHWTPHGPKAHG